MKKLILIFVAFLLSFSAIFADEPIFDDEAPTYYTTFPNRKFFLGCNSGKNTTTCFEITGNGKKEKWMINDFSTSFKQRQVLHFGQYRGTCYNGLHCGYGFVQSLQKLVKLNVLK